MAKSDELKKGTEGLIIAAQDQSLPIRNYRVNVIKNGSNPIWCEKIYQLIT